MAASRNPDKGRTGSLISNDVFQALKETYCTLENGKSDKHLHDDLSRILSTPPIVSILRVNYFKSNMDSATKMLQSHFSRGCQEFTIARHPKIDDILLVSTHDKDLNGEVIIPQSKEVIVDELCGVAVLRGADVFACGVLGASSGIVKGDCVSIYADLEKKCRRGLKLDFEGQKYFVGNGIAVLSRNEIFREKQPRGVAIKVTSQSLRHPSFHELDRTVFFAQNLPSTLVCHNLQPIPGEIVLDICAAPGGKATHAAIMMRNKGKVFAIDKSKARVQKMKVICDQQGLSCVKSFVFDSTQLCSLDGGLPSHDEYPPFRPCSFDKIILDPPCSGIGQRPQLQCKLAARELKSYPVYQRKLFSQAVKLLKQNGKLIYSTCTITIEENENQVAWALENFKELKLVSQQLHLGARGISGHRLSTNDCYLVQRFDPCLLSITDAIDNGLSSDQDTIGFFIALFTKV